MGGGDGSIFIHQTAVVIRQSVIFIHQTAVIIRQTVVFIHQTALFIPLSCRIHQANCSCIHPATSHIYPPNCSIHPATSHIYPPNCSIHPANFCIFCDFSRTIYTNHSNKVLKFFFHNVYTLQQIIASSSDLVSLRSME